MNASADSASGMGRTDPIETLKGHVAAMSELAVGMVADGARALLSNDRALAASVTARDTPLDRFDIAIETEAMRLIATLQPEAKDLRTIGAVLKVANCVDRVGRLGYDLAQNLTAGPEPSDPTPADLLRQMDERSRAMVQRSVEAFVRGDAVLAKSIFALDDDVDELHEQLQNRVIELLKQGGEATERLARFLLAGRHLERVGDNACKIAEKAVYAITGERRPEYFPALAHRATTGVRPVGHSH
ncbi:MAG TPA: phosphate signaling complex protein PhoU [Thermoplasmata archaeon]|nr:phosphate signaling complex protein PhoU [Thermoplasmata archaeon]